LARLRPCRHHRTSTHPVDWNLSSVAGPPHSIPAFPAFPHGPAPPSTTTQQPSTSISYAAYTF
jgi:hypothetical protein